LSTPADSEVTLHLRRHVPAVVSGAERGWRFFDGPSGTQMIDGCIDAMRDYLLAGVANRREAAPTGDLTEEIIAQARADVQLLLNGAGYRVVFGQNMTSLAYALAHATARQRARSGSAIVLSELEHFGNVDPWRQAFAERGVPATWLPVDPGTLRLSADVLDLPVWSGPVDLVAITLASNAIGTVPDVAKIAEVAHQAGALVVVDGVHAVPHQVVDLAELGADLFFCSAYKFYGPHIGIALIKEDLAESLVPYKLAPAPASGPDKFETGSQNHEAIAGLVGTFASLAHLAGEAGGTGGAGGTGAREAIGQLTQGQLRLADWIEGELRSMPKVQLFRADGASGERAPTIAFRVAGRHPAECADLLRQRGLFITYGDVYASALAERLGVAADGGWARLGIAGYNLGAEAAALVEAIAAL
jgi:cysteine desulfurase family protein (TIGR01976 family)